MANDGTALLETADEIAVELLRAGHRTLYAGGCVRDRLLGRPPKDVDLATAARPEQVLALFPGATAVGKAFGVVVVPRRGFAFEVATFRRDLGYEDGRRPTGVEYGDEQEDALRRDFTVNALFLDPADGRVIDYVGGRADLAARLIRCVGDPAERFAEDHLRMLRAVRFTATLDFRLAPATAAAIRRLAPRLADISPERVQQELTRLLTESPRAGRGLRLLREVGLLAVILPEVAALAGVAQPPQFHPEGDVFEHTARMLDMLERPSVELAYAALLHDAGKPATARLAAGRDGVERWRFDEHDRAGADLAGGVLRRLRLPNRVVETVVLCVRDHMRFAHLPEMREAKRRRLMGDPTYAIQRELHRLDCLASHGDLSVLAAVDALASAYREETALPRPLVGGRDLLELGVPAGPEIGRRLREVYDRQLEAPGATREDLLDWLRGQVPPASGGTAPRA
jgi:poly(A) polymerase